MSKHLSLRTIAILFSAITLALTPLSAAAENAFFSENDILFYDPAASEVSCSVTPSGGSTGGKVPTNFSLGKEPAERQANLVKALMGDYGLTAQQAAGPVGNFMHESGGKHLPPNINEGGVAGPPKFYGGYGWAQWTASRQDTFIAFAIKEGYMKSKSDEATDAANYAYLKKELNEGYQETIKQLKLQDSPESAAVSFEATFERAGVPALGPRKLNAREAFQAYQNGGGGAGSSTDSSNCAGAGGAAAIVGDVAFPLLGSKKVVNNPQMFRNGDTDLGGHPYTAYDILADPGVPVVAFMSGTVVSVSSDRCPGRLITIYNKESNLAVSYMHMSFKNHIQEGDTVQPGDKVGVVGTDREGCTISHLHIDVMKGRVRLACSRLSCASSVKSKFVPIGKELYETFQAMPEN